MITIHESWLSRNGPEALPAGVKDKKVRYPFIFPREKAFYEALRRKYDVVMTFDDKSGVFPVGSEPLVGGGLFAKLRG